MRGPCCSEILCPPSKRLAGPGRQSRRRDLRLSRTERLGPIAWPVQESVSLDVPDDQADSNRRLRLSFVGAHKCQAWHRYASSEQLRGSDVNSIESPNGMCRHERFGAR